jgi:hypothetical protein
VSTETMAVQVVLSKCKATELCNSANFKELIGHWSVSITAIFTNKKS